MSILSYVNWRDPRVLVAGVLVMVFSIAGAMFFGGGSIFDSPENAVKSFVASLNEGNGQKALNYICGDMVLPEKPPKNFLQNVGYETIDDNGTAAHVRFMGEIRVTGGGVTGKKILDFTVTLGKWRGKWCVDKESGKSLVDDLLKAH